MKVSERHKYGAKVTEVDGIRFPSKRQAQRYTDLKLLERAGEITELQLEVTYTIVVNNVKICSYRADFVYREHGFLIVEDCKGYRTPVYKLKKKLMKACYGIEIRET